MTNLLRPEWAEIDSGELRLLLDEHIGGPGQYEGLHANPNILYLPLAGAECRVMVTFQGNQIAAVRPGPAFDAAAWQRIVEEIDQSLVTGVSAVGREISFNSFRVTGWWRGLRSSVQICPAPPDAPRAPVEIAQHAFILEFPVRRASFWRLTNHRRQREHRRLSRLMNVLLNGYTSVMPQQSQHLWAVVPREHNRWNVEWVQEFYVAKFGEAVVDELSLISEDRLQEEDPEEYYKDSGHDGRGLRVPADLDDGICQYQALPRSERARLDRALFWVQLASAQWHLSMSASFASLVSAVESLTPRGASHDFKCPVCCAQTKHEVPGPTKRFRDFFETYAPGASLATQRSKMYDLRSTILHGSGLMQFDQERSFGWDPPGWHERELHGDLWRLTRVALRNWLKRAS